MFLCLFTTEAVVGPNSEQADASTTFFICSNQRELTVRFGACGLKY